jgi:hypothetical protein
VAALHESVSLPRDTGFQKQKAPSWVALSAVALSAVALSCCRVWAVWAVWAVW